MFPSSFLNNGHPETERRFVKGVQLALDLCDNTPGQFKLVETPLNSFLLVSNVLPESRPVRDCPQPEGFDFEHIHLPKLTRMQRVLGRYCDHVNNDDTCVNVKASSSNSQGALFYLPYGQDEWNWALTLRKDKLVKMAVEGLSDPTTWKGLEPVDPLPLIWLLFYGSRSFCREPECLYERNFGMKGPILLPPHMYAPQKDVMTFVHHVIKYVKFLYVNAGGGLETEPSPPFEASRLRAAIARLGDVEADDAYLSAKCMLCHLYKQNDTISIHETHVGGVIALGGDGARYITSSVRAQRCTSRGDFVLIPLYNIEGLVSMIREHGLGSS
ncbi:ORF 34 [Macacine gammaherpesvirus 5]|uniref:ORF34 n=1 Tax=Rhesus monkey rhadinovirus H26-95 TaxID=69256 RepID=Q9J2K7_9GAMA|nr:ORF34 [Rhesus monkey rhadinovirus H26-95]QFN51622.1 ORF 34 [Macacine gammaherpesvirus 5]QFN51718.1 ORF 34 [Macacine gammaherpesvirus 5]QFN51809.1 ORF 34 [Macacine gammaherpesvirus 5]QFQ66804.1 ORF 34 [Macacine gammaherpesvirus 5]